MAEIHPKILLVEGTQDRLVIPELMEANGVNWRVNNAKVVYIHASGGYQNLADPDVISAQLKASRLSALGIMIDADYSPLERWQSIRNASLKSIPDLPETLPEEGLIHTTPNGIKFGIWMMPDNKMCGMLETFLTSIP